MLTTDIKTLFLDVDSCISSIEGIDELGKLNSIDVSDLTARAMNGELSFDDVFKKRLDRIQPTQDNVEHIGHMYIKTIMPGVDNLLSFLKEKHIDTHIMSAGYQTAVALLAAHLGINRNHVHANELLFNADRTYKGFNTDNPLAHSYGKKKLLEHLLQSQTIKPPIAIIGDGMSEVEAKPPADIVIGYGGVIVRESVREHADYYIMHFEEILSLLTNTS